MAEASYERQHIALHAAGFISGDGATTTTFGCTMTRVGTGTYAMVLDISNGVVSDETFLQVMPKINPAIEEPRNAVGVDTSNLVKTVVLRNRLNSLADAAIEVALFKSVTK